ncbi:hypothetical protein THAOC_19324, partial [Thalassiosira oceanica]
MNPKVKMAERDRKALAQGLTRPDNPPPSRPSARARNNHQHQSTLPCLPCPRLPAACGRDPRYDTPKVKEIERSALPLPRAFPPTTPTTRRTPPRQPTSPSQPSRRPSTNDFGGSRAPLLNEDPRRRLQKSLGLAR